MNHYFKDVPGQGNIAVSRHAQDNVVNQGISEEDFTLALLEPHDEYREGEATILQRNGVRLVIITPTPFRGARLVKTVFKIKPQKFV